MVTELSSGKTLRTWMSRDRLTGNMTTDEQCNMMVEAHGGEHEYGLIQKDSLAIEDETIQ